MTAPVEITQADREAAADAARDLDISWAGDGSYFGATLAQAFARHRQSSLPKAEEAGRVEAEHALARLRTMADHGRIDAAYGDFSHPVLVMIADVRKAFLSTPPQAGEGVAAAPSDMVLVPRVPTEAMCAAFTDAALKGSVHGAGGWHGYAREQWSTMLAAAPVSASPMPGEALNRDAIARIVIGPRNAIPESSPFTLQHLQNVRWDRSSNQERAEALWIADAILAALAHPPSADQVGEGVAIGAGESALCTALATIRAHYEAQARTTHGLDEDEGKALDAAESLLRRCDPSPTPIADTAGVLREALSDVRLRCGILRASRYAQKPWDEALDRIDEICDAALSDTGAAGGEGR